MANNSTPSSRCKNSFRRHKMASAITAVVVLITTKCPYLDGSRCEATLND
jgi:hypothetical protein